MIILFSRFLNKIGIDGFILLLVLAVGLAWIWPSFGAGRGPFSLYSFANYGISVIFFFYGLKLNLERFRTGLGNWHLHIFVHLTTFVLFPSLILLIRPLFQGEENVLLWLGIFYLAALPSAVSSSVVMVSIAKGNIPMAIIIASISSLLGVFITPLWMSLILSSTAEIDIANLWSIILRLVLQIILPVVLGMTLNHRWGTFAEKHHQSLRIFDQSVILLIVYTSFCASFAQQIFEGFSWIKIVACTTGMIVLFFIIYGIVALVCRKLKFNREDTISVLFCGSKKSLMHGAAMSKVIFAGFSGIGVILLPIMIYHAMQLMLVSAIARRKAKDS